MIRQTCSRRLAAAALAALLPAAAAAQDRPLPDMTLEELMRIEVKRVFGASERLQPVTEAPSSVTIVTRDEIARYGYRTLADVLRSVRGFYVSDDRNYSYLGARGFARPGDYNTRVLLLVNGHRVNDNVFDQAAIGAEFGLDVATIERVEVIRGPASALYGTSAFFAVVNVVTRTGASIDGGAVHAEAGSLGSTVMRAMAGRRLTSGVDLAVAAGVDRADGVDRLYFPAFDSPATNHGVAQGLDGEDNRTLYGRLSFRDLTVTAMWGTRHKDVPTASFATTFNAQDPNEHTTDVHSFADARYERALGPARVALRAALDRNSYRGRYPYESSVTHDGYLGTRFTIDGSASTTRLPRQTMTMGGEFVKNISQDLWLQTTGTAEDLEDVLLKDSSTQHALFFQDEIKVLRWLIVNAGVRRDAYRSFSRITPRGALIVIPSANQSFKYLYGRAFRAPNAYELRYYPPVAELAPESIDTHEVVWEQYVGEWLRTSVSTFWYRASRLIAVVSVDPTPLFPEGLGFVNSADAVDARGLELEAEVRTRQGVQAVGSYVWQRTQARESRAPLTNSPRHLALGRISVPGPLNGSAFALDVRYLSDRTTRRGGVAAGHTVANVAISVPLARGVELTANIRNLFDTRYADPSSDEHAQDAIEQNGRTFRTGVRWTFGK